MPTSYRIDPERELVVTRAWGAPSSEDLEAHYANLITDPRFRPSYRQLGDLSAVTTFSVDAWRIAQVAATPVFDTGTRRALIAPSEVGFGLSSIFAAYSERAGQDVRVFRERDEAEAWLGE